MKQILSYRFSITMLSFAVMAGAAQGQKPAKKEKPAAKKLQSFTIKGELGDSLDGRTVGDPVRSYIMVTSNKPDTSGGRIYQPVDEQGFYLCAGPTTIKGATLEHYHRKEPSRR